MAEPALYGLDQLLRDAARHGELVVFVGAGASVLCGSPLWPSFASQVVDALHASGSLNFLEAEQLRGIPDPRRTLSVALKLAEEAGVHIPFDQILHPGEAKRQGAELYELLAALNPVFVTTNYDKWLDIQPSAPLTDVNETTQETSAPPPRSRSVYYRREDLTSDRLAERGAVIHIHGSYREPQTMVVSLRDYIHHYADEGVRTFLAEMFRNYTVLFVGYGLAELELLDYVIRSQESSPAPDEARHFLLYPHRSSEEVQKTFIQRFYKEQCGVRVLPYCIDRQGFSELVEVFRTWAPLLETREPSLLERQAHIDRCVRDQNLSSQRKAAIRAVDRNPELAPYLLNAIRDPVWFADLDSAGFFSSDHRPSLKVITEGLSNYYHFENWPALKYLEQIAPAATGSVAERMMEIVRSVDQVEKASDVENWRTAWTLAAIVSRLPLAVVTLDDIRRARRWLQNRFEANMIGIELGKKLLPKLLDSPDESDVAKALELVDVLTTLAPKETP